MKRYHLLVVIIVTMLGTACSFRPLSNGTAIDLIRADGKEITVLVPAEQGEVSSGDKKVPGIVFLVEPASTDTKGIRDLRSLANDDLKTIINHASDRLTEAMSACENDPTCTSVQPLSLALFMWGCAHPSQGGTFPPVRYPHTLPRKDNESTPPPDEGPICICVPSVECDQDGICMSVPDVQCQ